MKSFANLDSLRNFLTCDCTSWGVDNYLFFVSFIDSYSSYLFFDIRIPPSSSRGKLTCARRNNGFFYLLHRKTFLLTRSYLIQGKRTWLSSAKGSEIPNPEKEVIQPHPHLPELKEKNEKGFRHDSCRGKPPPHPIPN